MKKSLIAAISVLATLGAANADEVWTSDIGSITYESEIDANDMAIFKTDGMTLYVAGLAGVTEGRGTYPGIWVMDIAPEGSEGCPVAIVRPETEDITTAFWGQLEITFEKPDFPSAWTAQIGTCFQEFDEQLIANPVSG